MRTKAQSCTQPLRLAVNPEWRNRYEVAVAAAREAGQLVLRYFEANPTVEWKPDLSPVTVADREAEALLRSRLLGAFPGDGFLGEESGNTPGPSSFRWIIDPIDGTRNFVRGIPLWGTLVGLEYRDEQIAGVADVPTLRQTYGRSAATALSGTSDRSMFPTSGPWPRGSFFIRASPGLIRPTCATSFCASTNRPAASEGSAISMASSWSPRAPAN